MMENNMCSNDYSRQLGEFDAVVSECKAFGNIEYVQITKSSNGNSTLDLIWVPGFEITDIKENKNDK